MVMQLLYICFLRLYKWFPFEVLTIFFKACLLICCSKHNASCCCDTPGQKKKKEYFRTDFFHKDNSRKRIISILTVDVVNDVHTYICL